MSFQIIPDANNPNKGNIFFEHPVPVEDLRRFVPNNFNYVLLSVPDGLSIYFKAEPNRLHIEKDKGVAWDQIQPAMADVVEKFLHKMDQASD